MASRRTSSVLNMSIPSVAPVWNTKVPIPCDCGYDRSHFQGSPRCPCVGLRNHKNFPPFLDLPQDNDISPHYYKMSPGSGLYKPHRHWCLMADVEEVTCDIRIRVQARTRYGEQFIIHFHLDEDDQQPKYWNFSELRPGRSSICILYAERHNFMDMTVGIRQERSSTIMVFPLTMKELLCGHENTLQNLVSFDFSTFKGYKHWSDFKEFGSSTFRGVADGVFVSIFICFCLYLVHVSYWRLVAFVCSMLVADAGYRRGRLLLLTAAIAWFFGFF